MDLSERGPATERHPWEIARFRSYRNILREHGALSARRVLDVGAGDGWFSEELLADLPCAEQVVCWDINYNDLELETDDPRLVRRTSAPEPGFDLVLVLDVLEHIADPVGFIDEQLRPLTTAGTQVLVAVPAQPWLFGAHDRALGHERRYTTSRLLSEVERWIDVIDHGPLFASLLAPRAASVAIERLRRDVGPRRRGVGNWGGGPVAARTLTAALEADVAITRRLGRRGLRPPGLSAWAYGIVR
jgi:SAM-dependent methyltransferase